MLQQERFEETGFSFSNEVPRPPERRGQERLGDDRNIKILRVGVLVVEGRRELCLIRNISAGGLMAHVYSKVAADQRVTVELKTNHNIEGRIVWVRDTNAGIQFDTQMDVAELLANPPVLNNGWRPRTPRIEIDRMATLRAGARTHWVHGLDISQSGAKVGCEMPLEPGTEIVLTLEGLRSLNGVVRWQRDDYCGIEFNSPIPFGELIDWLKRGG